MSRVLELRRERIRKLIDLATQDRNPVKQWQGYALLTEVNRRLLKSYSFNNLYSNLA